MLKRLNNQSGASLVFVLAAMLMLLSIGGSAMAAATSSRGAVLEKRALNQLHLLADSVQETVGSQLTGPMDLINEPEKHQLVDTIIREIAKNVEAQIAAGSLTPGKGITATIPPIQFPMTATLNIPGLPQAYQEDGSENTDITTVTLNLSVRCSGATFTGYRGVQWGRKTIGTSDEGIIFEDRVLASEVVQSLVISGCEVTVQYIAQQRDPYVQTQKTLTSTATYLLPDVIMAGWATNFIQSTPENLDAFKLYPRLVDAGESGKYIDVIYSLDELTDEVDGVFIRAVSDPPITNMIIIIVGDGSTGSDEGRAVSYEKTQNNPDESE